MAVIVPGAEWRPNPVSSRAVLPRWIYLHTIVGTVSGALGGRHYHIYVRADGSFVQIQDLRLRSAASVEMNPYSIAIVAEDKGPAFPPWTGSSVPPYTPQQVATLILVISWICHRFGIPTSAARTSCLNSPHGVAWHRLGIDGNFPNQWPYWGRQPGCLETSLSEGKPCPGNARITQIINDIVPRLSSPTSPPSPPVRNRGRDLILLGE
jgi:N-acetylmuramoyl-L-alanine amidase